MITITDNRRYCNCCGNNDRVKEITFWTNHDKVHSGISVALCKSCRSELVDKLAASAFMERMEGDFDNG